MNLLGFDLQLPITDPTWIFLLVLTIILFAPMVLGRLRIPHIIGMILAGVLIGEYGLNILERDSSFELFGKVGLYYIMFLAGLEMDMDDFKQNRVKALVFGLFTFSIPMVLGIVSGVYILEYSLVTSVLLASMYASHTLIAYPTVSRYGLSRLSSVSITIGGTAITVTLALLILAVIAGMYKGEIDEYFWYFLTFKICFVVIFIVFVFPRLARVFFRNYEDNIMQFVFVLALVFLGGGLLEIAGLEGILGAFLVGLVLNRLIPRLSPLMNRLEFVGNALFIPYFLIGVGMIIDVRTLFKGGEALKVAVVMTIVATFSKWLAAWLTQKSYGMKPEERSMMFGLSNAQAAATLAAVLVGNKLEISPGVPLLNDDVLNGTVVMILFTCIISSVITERASRRIAAKQKDANINKSKPKEKENILIPVANPDTIEELINTALLLKNPQINDGLVALHVINDDIDSDFYELRGKQCLEKAASVGASADVRIQTVMRYDLNIASGIIHTLKEYDASEIVIGLHKKANIVDSFFGALTASLLTATHKQVLIMKAVMPVNTLRRMVVAVPSKAEYESGFTKWVKRLCRMSSQLGCRIHFNANKTTLGYIKGYIDKHHKGVRVQYNELEDWDDLLLLTSQVNYDHLFIVISARRGTISYQPSLEELPDLLSRYFTDSSLLVLYPDQHGDPQEMITFAKPIPRIQKGIGQQISQWIAKIMKKN